MYRDGSVYGYFPMDFPNEETGSRSITPSIRAQLVKYCSLAAIGHSEHAEDQQIQIANPRIRLETYGVQRNETP